MSIRVIICSYAGSVEACVVVNEDMADKVAEELQGIDDEVDVKVITPDTVQEAFAYMRST